MTLPMFSASDDPGPSFSDLLRRTRPADALPEGPHTLTITHGTTVLGVRYTDGVFVEGSTTATVIAATYDGTPITGLDTINYVP